MTPKQTAKLTKEQEERFDEWFCTAVGGSLQMKGCFDIGFGTSPEVMPQVKAFLADELQRQREEILGHLFPKEGRYECHLEDGQLYCFDPDNIKLIERMK